MDYAKVSDAGVFNRLPYFKVIQIKTVQNEFSLAAVEADVFEEGNVKSTTAVLLKRARNRQWVKLQRANPLKAVIKISKEKKDDIKKLYPYMPPVDKVYMSNIILNH